MLVENRILGRAISPQLRETSRLHLEQFSFHILPPTKLYFTPFLR